MSALETVGWARKRKPWTFWALSYGKVPPAQEDEYEQQEVTLLAPAQAEIERLREEYDALAIHRDEVNERLCQVMKERDAAEARALAAEERVKVLSEALEKAEATARLYAGYYPQGSDGRNTFIILADQIAARSSQSEEESR